MSDPFPSVTVLIPTRPDQADIPAVTAARRFDYPREKLEIIVARGKQPSVQRNTAIKQARGEWIYFLDDDSQAPPGNLQRAASYFKDPKVKMVGGPNLCPPDAPPLEQIFALVLASWLAFGPSRARYAGFGRARETSEKELISCNLLARRDALLEFGGFNEALYPNEENALMDELKKRGGKLIHDPQLIVYRRPRHNLKAFAKMAFTYGRGRAEQFRVNPTLGSAPNFVPPLFVGYLLAVAFLGRIGLIPLAAYGLALIVQAAALTRHGKRFHCLAAIPLMALTNIGYGIGFWRGMFTKLKTPQERTTTPVKLETVAL